MNKATPSKVMIKIRNFIEEWVELRFDIESKRQLINMKVIFKTKLLTDNKGFVTV
jgi:hypothetical protein